MQTVQRSNSQFRIMHRALIHLLYQGKVSNVFSEYYLMGNCVAQLCFPDLKVIIELEGYDDLSNLTGQSRYEYFRSLGYILLRYEAYMIRDFPEIVIEDIQAALNRR